MELEENFYYGPFTHDLVLFKMYKLDFVDSIYL